MLLVLAMCNASTNCGAQVGSSWKRIPGRTHKSTSRGLRDVRSILADSWHVSAVCGQSAPQRVSTEIKKQKVQYCTGSRWPAWAANSGASVAPYKLHPHSSSVARRRRLACPWSTLRGGRARGALLTLAYLAWAGGAFDCPPPWSAFQRTPRRSRVACHLRDGHQAVTPRLRGLGVPRDRLVGSTRATGSSAIRSWPRHLYARLHVVAQGCRTLSLGPPP